MNFFNRIFRSNFLIRLQSWEYWPSYVIQFPLYFYWLWLSLRARSLLFFSASNPGIPMGGMLGESKFEILQKIPSQFIPKSILVSFPSSLEEVKRLMKINSLQFPVIYKPDLGERGWMVKKIESEIDIKNYLIKAKVDFIIQEWIDSPMEFGVFYIRKPGEKRGEITSVVLKEMLYVIGDGVSTLKALILQNNRAKLQWRNLSIKFCDQLSQVVPLNKRIELVSIGNHCLGTKFLNAKHLINESLISVFDDLANQINGFNFGRFDLRANSLQDLYGGKLKILELNGCGAEIAHIYHPGYSLFKAWRELFLHWDKMYLVSMTNHKNGVKFLTLKEGFNYYKKFKSSLKD